VVLDSQGPVLVSEPRSNVEFSNDTGAMIHCSAHGSPAPRIDWLMGDGSPVLPIPHIREMLVNGSMYFLPFGAESYRHDVHSAVYRCQASNSVGKVLGREITVKAGKKKRETFRSIDPLKLFLEARRARTQRGKTRRTVARR